MFKITLGLGLFRFKCLVALLLVSAAANANPNQPTGLAIFNLLLQKMDLVVADIKSGTITGAYGFGSYIPGSDPCIAVNGGNEQFVNEPPSSSSNGAFWDWYVSCLTKRYLPIQFENVVTQVDLDKYEFNPEFFPADVINSIGKMQKADPLLVPTWAHLTAEQKMKITIQVSERIIGPGIIEDFQKSTEDYARTVVNSMDKIANGKLDLGKSIQYLTFFVLISDEFLKN